jgi:hypothetical protein
VPLAGPNAQAANPFDEDRAVPAQAWNSAIVRNRQALFKLPPLSFLAATLRTT